MKHRKTPFGLVLVLWITLILFLLIPMLITFAGRSDERPMDIRKARVLVSEVAVDIGNSFPRTSISNPSDLLDKLEEWTKKNEVSLYILSLNGDILYQNSDAPPLTEKINIMEFAQPDSSFYHQFPGFTRLMVPALKNGVQVANILFLIPIEKVSAKEDLWTSISWYWLGGMVAFSLSLLGIVALIINKHYETPYRWLLSAMHAAERNSALPKPPKENHMTPAADGMLRLVDQWQDTFGKLAQSEQYHKEQLAVLSHEIRTPITSIAMYAEGLESGVADSPEKREAYIAALARKTRELNRLVGVLFDHARQELDILRVDPVEVYSRPVFDEIIKSLKESFSHSERNHQWPSNIPNILAPIDRLRMEQVLSNLIHNSVKHTDVGGTISLDIFLQDDHLVVTVTDNGQGIDPADIPYIFDRFYQGKGTYSVNGSAAGPGLTDPTGAGLGLSICRSIIDAHGGRLYVESSLSKGTRMTIVL